MLAKSQTKLNRFTRAEWFTAVSFIGILIILILILALCFAICCLCHRERKNHRVFKQIRRSENCSNPLPAACASTFSRCSCPRTEGYQEKYEKRDCNHQVEPEILEYHLCATRNDHCKYCPEFTDSRQNSSVETPRMITTISKNDGHSLMDKDNLLCQNNCSDVRPDSPAQSKQCMTEDSKHDRSSKMHQTNDSCEFSHRDERSNQQNLTAVPIQCRCTSPGMDCSNAARQSDITACELICPERSVSGTSEDSEDSTSTTESCDEMLVDKCDAECQSNYPVSRMPSEDCKSTSVALCLNKVEEISSNCKIIQSNSQAQMMPCDDLSDSTSSSQSSYQEYLSSLPTDISTPRSESSSQISLSSEIADDFVNNSECSVNSSMPSETLLNLMQRYFASGDDVKSVKISILLDKSQSDDLSHSSIVEESSSGSYCQNNSQSDSEQYSRIGLKNKCGFLHCKNNSTDVEPSLASVENHARNSSSVHSQVVVHFDSQIPSMVDGSSDRYCAEDKEPCSKTTTVRYVFTDSETDV